MSFAICPACGEDIRFHERTLVGQNTVCPRCQENLTVVTLEPIILELNKISRNSDLTNSEKQEAAKKHERKVKNRHGEIEEIEDRDEDWRRMPRRSRSRSRSDW